MFFLTFLPFSIFFDLPRIILTSPQHRVHCRLLTCFTLSENMNVNIFLLFSRLGISWSGAVGSCIFTFSNPLFNPSKLETYHAGIHMCLLNLCKRKLPPTGVNVKFDLKFLSGLRPVHLETLKVKKHSKGHDELLVYISGTTFLHFKSPFLLPFTSQCMANWLQSIKSLTMPLVHFSMHLHFPYVHFLKKKSQPNAKHFHLWNHFLFNFLISKT